MLDIKSFQELHNHTSYVTPGRRILFEKLTIAELVNKFIVIYGTPRFITTFTRACHWSVS
jgi:hypothetical protein